jgi:hypothetical protein
MGCNFNGEVDVLVKLKAESSKLEAGSSVGVGVGYWVCPK